MTEKSTKWRERVPFRQYLTVDDAINEIKPGPSYFVKGTPGVGRRAAHMARISRMVRKLLERLP